jgi:hypothetical protein
LALLVCQISICRIYRKRIEELEFVQRTQLKALLEEKEKSEEKQNKSIINQLSKTIADNSKVEMRMHVH